MEIEKARALELLGIGNTTLYNRVNKLGIKLRTKSVGKTKTSCITKEDLEKIATAMEKTIQREETPKTPNPSNSAEESAESKHKEQSFDLLLKVKQQEEQLKASTEMIDFYKEQTGFLVSQQQETKTQINTMYAQMITITNKATAYGVTAIALGAILIVFVVLVALGMLQF